MADKLNRPADLFHPRHEVAGGHRLIAQVEKVSETLSGAAVENLSPKGFPYKLPARSMTAFEVIRKLHH